MDYKVSSGIWGTMFGVPAIVADNFLKLATESQIKVLIYILRNSGRSCTDGEISENTGVPVQQVSDCIAFWQQVNVLTAEKNSIIQPQSVGIAAAPTDAASEPQQKLPEPAASAQKVKIEPPVRKQNLKPSEISQLMQDSVDISQLLKMAESIMGILGHTQQNSLIWMYSYLGLKIEVIITLLSYCVSIDKTNSSYIEKIAAAWSEQEINTLDAAQEEVTRMRNSRDYVGQIMKAFEMKRKPTAKQLEIADQWRKIGFSMELIHYAYEKTIEQIDKLSFEYINKILLSWRDSGYASVSDVKNSESEYRKKQANFKSSNSKDYDDFDIKKYEQFINNF